MTPYIPDNQPLPEALSRTTHLAIGAHQDDLEFMAFRGILACYEDPDNWFSGVTCTDGGGSARTGPFAGHTDEQMKEVRHQEQDEAARLGQYAAQYQLRHPSSMVKSTEGQAQLGKELADIFTATTPHTLYTHSPADKHPSHLAVFAATLKALRSLPKDQQPQTWIGCEVWRDLDWVPDERKVAMNVSARPELAAELNNLFLSQIAGGKNYHHAIIGRRTANATFSNPHATDDATQLIFGLDLMPLLEDPNLSPIDFTLNLINEFKDEVQSGLSPYL
ncbi:PIG-L deacetylase family protein [Roseibacillus persicicus]|uniref:PIG-L deacetylase family protein n=1 Tax=Roseibacillus persicicus TaxID=454148 RepID=UPI00280CCF83|nr:PIG-L family deacetylase [Roseibacillus persicicus]MDQ8190471.1 PIG-L family deacetylase [Roseibacillus persicicus]